MVKNWRYRLTVGATNLSMLLGLGAGIALAAPHCDDEGTSGCNPGGLAAFTCCVDGVLKNCNRRQYECISGSVTTYRWSGPQDCTTIQPVTNCT
jgi:hypothetical protein